MKSAAIVLGLALAVNAQVDNELATSFPSHPSGADLVRNAAWGRSQPTHTAPKHTNPTYWSKNDDVADDELVQTFNGISGADLVKYAKQSQQTVYRPTAHVVRDDEADDEMMVYYTKDSQGNKHYQGGYTVRRDDEADDELFGSLSGADLVKYAKQSQSTTYRPVAHVVRDDAADEELMVRLLPREAFATEEEYQKYILKWRFSKDDADDELMVYYTKDSRGVNQYQGGYTRRDDAADDELVQTFYSPSGADLVKYAKQSQQTVYRPTAHVVRDDEADDEMMVYYTKDSQGNKHYQGGYTVRRDDASDDELFVNPYNPSGADLAAHRPRPALDSRGRPYTDMKGNILGRPVYRDAEADDEMMVYYTKDSQGNKHYQGGYTVRRDDVADDELVQTFNSYSGADLVKYAKQSQQTVYRPTAHVVRDDEADDELVQTFGSYSGADLVKYAKESQQTVYRPAPAYPVRRDDEADDELVQTFGSYSGADLVKYAKESQQTVYRPAPAYPIRRDDADDELVSLGHLIKEAANEKIEKNAEVKKYFRHL